MVKLIEIGFVGGVWIGCFEGVVFVFGGDILVLEVLWDGWVEIGLILLKGKKDGVWEVWFFVFVEVLGSGVVVFLF